MSRWELSTGRYESSEILPSARPAPPEGRWAKISPLSIRPMDNLHRNGARPFQSSR